ncbi:hypothetical protein AK812_SmicGene15657 [Symbiodinium microadriaticum]|uniref:Uncharacterized protein n=1 Tax=Symbiodinium microadriaticum TaxID=2951 RepID=A0A1Q9E2B7_SYMMI|nr:hypothetical protein AK812_SmicGene15657 [Symbiodinium microadriaticum]
MEDATPNLIDLLCCKGGGKQLEFDPRIASTAAARGVDLQQIKTQVEKEVDRFKSAPLRSPPLSAAVAADVEKLHDDSFRQLLRGINRWMLGGGITEEVCKNMIRSLFRLMCRMQATQMLQSPPDCVSVMHVAAESTMDVISANSAYRKLMPDTKGCEFQALNGQCEVLHMILREPGIVHDLEGAGRLQLEDDARLVGTEQDEWATRIQSQAAAAAAAGVQPMFNVQSIDFVIMVLQPKQQQQQQQRGTDFPKTLDKLSREVEGQWSLQPQHG